MSAVKPDQDIVSLSDFRANVSEYLKQTQSTRRPVFITQHGRGAGVLLAADEYSKLMERIEVMRSIGRGLVDVATGNTVPWEEVRDKLLSTIETVRKPARKAKRA